MHYRTFSGQYISMDINDSAESYADFVG